MKLTYLRTFRTQSFRDRLAIYLQSIGRSEDLEAIYAEIKKSLRAAEYRECRTFYESVRTLGFCGLVRGRLVFGLVRPLRLWNRLAQCASRHELIHLAQHHTENALKQEEDGLPYLARLRYEVQAIRGNYLSLAAAIVVSFTIAIVLLVLIYHIWAVCKSLEVRLMFNPPGVVIQDLLQKLWE